MKAFIIDLAACNGCYNCQLACKDEHVGNDWMPVSAPQPDTGHFWCAVHQFEHGSIPKVQVEYRPTLCYHCSNAPCMLSQPQAFYRRADGLVILDPAKAGNQAIVDACPFGNIYWNEELGIAQKCSGCAHLVDDGKLPHCVDLCVIGALRFGEESEFVEDIAKADYFVSPELGPRVYYINAPKLFIGGEVWDKQADEVIKGATVSLSGRKGFSACTTSDNFGDFWFRRLEPDEYSVSIQAEGYRPVERQVRLTDKGLNIGDFPLEGTG